MPYTYYAVRRGRKPGVYENWDECEAQVIGYKAPIYKGFHSYEAAVAFWKGTRATPRPSRVTVEDEGREATLPLTPEIRRALTEAGVLPLP